MSYKKLLTVILVVIGGMFALMLTTSYAWYSYENASTTFDAVTNNDDITVNFAKGAAINTTTAVPIASEDVEQYAEKNNFTIKVKNAVEDNDIIVDISLVDISIDSSLRNANFMVDLYYQGSLMTSYAGNTIGVSGATTKDFGTVTLDNYVDNDFELRVYILDNGEDQNSLMGKTFQAKIQVKVVSRLKSTITQFSNPDIYVSSITIDGTTSSYLPTSGYYTMSASCTKGSSLSWDSLTKTITYASGSYINDTCSLTFTSSTSYPLLSSVEPGSYVAYTGTNGCDGTHCEGDNANYVNDMDMGYCNNNHFKFVRNGWRVAYISGNTAYLVSAGAPECYRTYMDYKTTSTTTQALSTNYYYGSGYTFDSATGQFTLTGVTSSALAWSSNYESIAADTPYTCLNTSSTGTCTTLYEVSGYYNETKGLVYIHYNYDQSSNLTTHTSNLNKAALKYCNANYVYGGTCDSNSVWNINLSDFQNMPGGISNLDVCLTTEACGYGNDLIDNGGYYWFQSLGFVWDPSLRQSSSKISSFLAGVRPVIRMHENVYITGGTGTYEDPYQIANS